jgi:hypothetical protein
MPPVAGRMIMGAMCPPQMPQVPGAKTGIDPALEPAESPLPEPTPQQLREILERLAK